MQKKYDVVIIGAGIGGLVCGCYLAKAGLKVLIVEKNDKPGGYCTSFERDGYRFDVGVHYLGGIKRGTLGRILEELEVKDNIKFRQFDPTDKIVMPENITYIRANPYDTIKEFKKSFPNERKNIERFFKFVMQRNFLEIYKKIRKLTFKQILDAFFNDYKLKGALNVLLGNIGVHASIAPALSGVILYREFILDPGYYPEGGMQSFSDALAKKFKEYGGEIMFSEEVKRILVKKKKVDKILLKGNKEICGKIVISNNDPRQTFCRLINIKTKESYIVKKLQLSPSIFGIYLGINFNRKNEVKTYPCVWISRIYDLNTSFVPSIERIVKGKFLLSMFTFFPILQTKVSIEIFTLVPFVSHSFWKNPPMRLVEELIKAAQREFGFKKNNLEIKEIATPVTFEKFTSNTQGVAFGWKSTLNQIKLSTFPLETSIRGLFIASQWGTVGSGQGGIPKVAFCGRKTAYLVLSKLKKEWPYSTHLIM